MPAIRFLPSRNTTTQGQSSHPGLPTGPLDILGPEKPLCPPSYSFDYDWQSCWPDGVPHRKPKSGELWKHACLCAPGWSWLAVERKCWERGAIPAGGARRPGGLTSEKPPATLGCAWPVPRCLQATDPGTVHAHVNFKLSGSNDHNHISDQLDVADLVKKATDLALAFALRAKHFLQFLLSRPASEQQELWDFGDLPGNLDEGATDISPLAFDRSPAPRYWFGPFSTARALEVLFVCDKVATRLSHGRKIAKRYHPFKIVFRDHCIGKHTVAHHYVYGKIVLCPEAVRLLLADKFLSSNPNRVFQTAEFHGSVGGVPGLAIVIFHEMVHHIIVPDHSWTHDIARGPFAARNLVLDGHFGQAMSNNDNYAHWVAAGYLKFGSCEAFDVHRIPHTCTQAYGQHGEVIYGKVTCCSQCLDKTPGQCSSCSALDATADGCP